MLMTELLLVLKTPNLSVFMEPEVCHGTPEFRREFKLDVVRLVKERGAAVAKPVIWKFTGTGSVSGSGILKPICRISFLARADKARAIGDRAAAPRSHQAQCGTGHPNKRRGVIHLKYSFIAKHRGIWPVEWLCGALGVSRGGFYAWLTRSPGA
jgi:putative transposase